VKFLWNIRERTHFKTHS